MEQKERSYKNGMIIKIGVNFSDIAKEYYRNNPKSVHKMIRGYKNGM